MVTTGSGQHFATAITPANSLQKQMGAAAGLVQLHHANSLKAPGHQGATLGSPQRPVQPSGQYGGPSSGLPQKLSGGVTSLHPYHSGPVADPASVVDRGGSMQQQPSGGVTSLHHYHSDSLLEQRPASLHPFNSFRCVYLACWSMGIKRLLVY